MPNILSNPSRVANIGYNGFDMSQKKKFSSTTGELLPVYYDFLQPGDKLSFSAFMKTRTMPLASAAMVECTEHLEWFFVPMEHIFHPFRSWYFQINDNHIGFVNPASLTSQFPNVTPADQLAFYNNWGQAMPVDSFGYASACRLWDMLNIPYLNFNDASLCVSITPFVLASYQAIYNDYYRLKDREDSLLSSYSLDPFYASPTSLGSTYLSSVSVLRYRPRKRDYFTNIFVSPLYLGSGGSQKVSNLDYLSTSFNQWLVDSLSYSQTDPSGTILLSGDGGSSLRPLANTQTQVNNQLFRRFLSPSSIRTSFAVEKLLEVTRRAGKTYDSQTLAHFGVNVPLSETDNVKFIGYQEQKLIIGDVIATADGTATSSLYGSSTSVLGQVSGKGYSATQNPSRMKFTAPCHGVLMCIYSCEVEPNYDMSHTNDKLNSLPNRSDWFTPEFDNLGMQPLFGYQADLDTFQVADVLGWQYRYSEYKIKFDTVHGAFRGYSSLNFWANHFAPYNGYQTSQLASFLCSPHDLDDVMLVKYSLPTAGIAPATDYWNKDPLLHEIYFDVKKASKMSTYGLPNL